jgi:hypothetical protein
MAEPFDLVSEMQHAAPEINDHQIISRAMEQRLLNLVFERFLPPFKIGDMVWLRHIFSEIVIGFFAKRAGALGTKVRGCSFFEGVASHTAQAQPAHFAHRRSRSSSSNTLLQW